MQSTFWATIPILLFVGCQTSRLLTEQSAKIDPQNIRVSLVHLKDGRTIDFTHEPLGYAIIRDSSIQHMTKALTIELIPLAQVNFAGSERLSSTGESIVDNAIWLLIGTMIFAVIFMPIVHVDIG